jgi:enoyl-CoA hydratase
VIAAVNGYALGGGLELMLSCDIAYASNAAKFGLPEATLGLVPGFGGHQRIIQRIGLARAKELIYTGRVIDATEALAIGLVNRVTEPDSLMERVMSLVNEICTVSPNALRTSKKLLNVCADLSKDDFLSLEVKQFKSVFGHPDARIGISAFVEKSTPVWKNNQ